MFRNENFILIILNNSFSKKLYILSVWEEEKKIKVNVTATKDNNNHIYLL